MIDEGGGGSTNGGGDMDWVLISVLLRGTSKYGPGITGADDSRRSRRTRKAVDGDDTLTKVGPIIDVYDADQSLSAFQEV